MKSLVFSLLLSAVGAQAATIHLKDGRKVEGDVLNSTADRVKIKTPIGETSIDVKDIDRIEYGEPAAPALQPPPIELQPLPHERWEPRGLHAGSHMISILPGAIVPLSDLDLSAVGGGSASNGDWGPSVCFQYLYQAKPKLGFGIETTYNHRSESETENLFPLAETNVSGSSWLFMAFLRTMFTEHGSARPYFFAGAGGHRTSTIIEAQPLSGFAWADTLSGERRRLMDDHVWGLAASLRLGVDFYQAEPSVFGLELGWTWLDGQTYDASFAGRSVGLASVSGPIHMLTISGRLGFKYGDGS